MARLDYDTDNFSGRYSRDTRYEIIVDGNVRMRGLYIEEAETFAEQYEYLGYTNIIIEEML